MQKKMVMGKVRMMMRTEKMVIMTAQNPQAASSLSSLLILPVIGTT